MTLINPLRYPGSKQTFVKDFAEFVVGNGLGSRQIVEPYSGSAAVSFGLLERGIVRSAILFERDPLIYSFWWSVLFATDELVERIKSLKVTIGTWHEFQHFLSVEAPSDTNRTELAVAALFFNRANFSGVIHAGPIGGLDQRSEYTIDCRFNKPDLIARIRRHASFSDRVEVYFGDAIQALTDANKVDNSGRFFYIDPPYYKQGKKLYRHNYDTTDHVNLSETLAAAKYDWILSYDRHHLVEMLYKNFHILPRRFTYSAKAPKTATELVITNLPDLHRG